MDNNWRDGELAKFKVNPHKVDQQLWDRMCIPMIYAHWEGYVVSSLRVLIGHLNKLQLSPKEVDTKLIVIGLGNTYNSLSGKQRFDQKVDFTNKFIGLFENAIKFKKEIDTKSNLNSKVLKELCDMFGFKFDSFENVSSDINRIVTFRNKIAHGENSILPDTDSIEKYISSVAIATDILLQEIDNFLSNKTYLQKVA
ncbi:MAE_28990/MAE_18760 family HEPN-like nuclease (plasmid) [Bermanella sp. WJH001]|uniref:MAE_28990/MAE_18760 family HEPN-like nuclease n=1 Tax=Bermanella sp. WJH001 TaxID=3048005 RepID=UPI0024BE0C84|nr:MAE_28990/MAE_18760 family HEPN-like nuclease [Bermanella sp. WJH001]MDJ1539457.1 MAE_28990/MAE_18760 family HEPN-like nuclease [Bermanella sp. WJH001]